MCSGDVSEVALDAAEAAAKIYPEVNSQRLFTRGRSAVDASAPSEPQALNTPEHIPYTFSGDQDENYRHQWQSSWQKTVFFN